ncbi:MAG: transketolase, partial [Deltaproteobacteria bacterium 21-66-5]
VDMNRLGQRGETELGWNSAAYAARAHSFGWHAVELSGHDLPAIDRSFAEALKQDRPTCLIAKTVKGQGFAEVANQDGWHGKALDEKLAAAAIKELGGERQRTFSTPQPEDRKPAAPAAAQPLNLKRYAVGGKEATRKAYGDALVALGAHRPEVVVLDGEVSNSTHADEFKKAYPDRFFEMFIAEQQLLGAAVGFSVLGKKAYASTFAAFFTRAYDQIRMAAISNAKIHLSGSHAGVSIGEDGPSQMALEDLALMRAVCDSTVLYPCDANQTGRLVNAMADLPGISYIRTTREKTPVIYAPDESFPIGGSKLVRRGDNDRVAVIGAGITLHEAVRAHDLLAREKIGVRVIDAYSVKPIDQRTLREAARDTQGRLVVVEDHWFEGGLGDAVLDAFTGGDSPLPRVVKLAVRKMPGSGSPEELRRTAGIDAEHIVTAVRSLLGACAPPPAL